MRLLLAASAAVALALAAGCKSETHETARQPAPPPEARLPENGELVFARGTHERWGPRTGWRLLAAREGAMPRLLTTRRFASDAIALSPDGRSLAFFGRLDRGRLEGGFWIAPVRGRARRVRPVGIRGFPITPDYPVEWSPDAGRVLAVGGMGVGGQAAWVVDVRRRIARVLRVRPEGILESAAWRDDDSVVGVGDGRFGQSDVFRLELATGSTRKLTDDRHIYNAWGVPGGRISFIRMAAERPYRYELWTMADDGADRRLVARLRGELERLAWSPDGTRVAVAVRIRHTPRLVVLSDRADAAGVGAGAGIPGTSPLWSPDGKRLAYVRGSSADLWVTDAELGDSRRLTATRATESPLAWLPADAR